MLIFYSIVLLSVYTTVKGDVKCYLCSDCSLTYANQTDICKTGDTRCGVKHFTAIINFIINFQKKFSDFSNNK